MDILETFTPQASVIGAILLDPGLMPQAMAALTADDFLADNCRIAWQAMCKIFAEGKTVDPILLKDALDGFAGAGQFVVQCMEAAPCIGNFQAHLQALKQQAMLAKLRSIGAQMSTGTDMAEVLELLQKANTASIMRSAKERRSMSGMFESFGRRHADGVTPSFLRWPIRALNDGVKVTGGKFLIIGGYPSDGKTAFALQSAIGQAKDGAKTAVYSYETDADTVEDRALALIAGVDMAAIQDNKLTKEDWSRISEARYLADISLDVISAAGMTVDDIRADALANRYDVIYIDYLQLIDPGRRNNNFSRFDEVSEISRSLQRLAKTTGITVIALSQMARPAADKAGKIPTPTMHSLRESGQIEQDADVIMLIYRQDHKDIRAPRFLDVAKNKEGRTGHFELKFDGEHQRFEAKEQRPQLPSFRRKPISTPVCGRDNTDSDQMAIITAEDPACPF